MVLENSECMFALIVAFITVCFVLALIMYLDPSWCWEQELCDTHPCITTHLLDSFVYSRHWFCKYSVFNCLLTSYDLAGSVPGAGHELRYFPPWSKSWEHCEMSAMLRQAWSTEQRPITQTQRVREVLKEVIYKQRPEGWEILSGINGA